MAVFTSGQRLSDRYLLDRCVGSGGMSQVWLAHDEVLGRPVAVKTIDGTRFDVASAARGTLLAAVRHEARTAASISHPHVAQVYDFGEAQLPDVEHAVPYLVMELLEGEDLGQRLAAGPLPWRAAARLAAEVAGALAAAHAAGIVHGDVKPANVMLTPAGAKVVDFGISTLGGAAADIPRAGTPAFLAPEVFAGDEASRATDVYALGVLLYAALTGCVPVAGQGWDEIAQAHRDGTPVATLVVAGLPDAIADLCARCLAASPDARPTSDEAAHLLRAAIRRPVPGPVAPSAQRAVGVGTAGVGTAGVGGRANTVALARSRPAAARWWRAPAAVAASVIMVTGLVLIAVAAFSTRGEAGTPLAGPTVNGPTANGPTSDAPTIEAAPPEQEQEVQEPVQATEPEPPADEDVVGAAPAQRSSSDKRDFDQRVAECLASVVEALKDRHNHRPEITPECRRLRSG